MLDLLRQNHDNRIIKLTHVFQRDVCWFDRFLLRYNGASMYNHRCVDHEVELDACLDGLGAVWKNFVYHVPLQHQYLNLSIVHLEMLNILVAVRVCSAHWTKRRFLSSATMRQ